MSDITKRAMSAALKNLLKEKKLNKITVQDIADECGINRQTFYYHFQDIYDLVEWTCIEDTEKVLKENRTYDTWQEGFLSVFDLAKKDKTFIDNIYRSVSLEMLEQYLYRLVYPLLKNVVDEKANGQTVREENKKYIADFYKYAFVGVLLEWIRNDMAESPGQIVDRVSRIVGGAIETAFANFNR
jgi:probable dihydroxyacetone kinase regulator